MVYTDVKNRDIFFFNTARETQIHEFSGYFSINIKKFWSYFGGRGCLKCLFLKKSDLALIRGGGGVGTGLFFLPMKVLVEDKAVCVFP